MSKYLQPRDEAQGSITLDNMYLQPGRQDSAVKSDSDDAEKSDSDEDNSKKMPFMPAVKQIPVENVDEKETEMDFDKMQ